MSSVQVPSIHPLQISPVRNTQRTQPPVLGQIIKLIQSAQHPIIVVDGCGFRHQLQVEAVDFIHCTGFPTFSTPMGKGIIDGITEEIEKSDLLTAVLSVTKSPFRIKPTPIDNNDGSFQSTAQGASVFIRKGLTPVIFLLNNNGYLTEKMINGPLSRL
ncbi:hypothetical protein INT48_005605 [Thamnidium elegans]|uniref:Thiamine pyrophosphate enzyme central domain-containing protein n=1 Tax=Thamnidium elegans TaxID=101142 RepID=A0A8H7VXD4_9FUNG|nr:hypothetical protein INT48_005605 [Thamnidium elegans]